MSLNDLIPKDSNWDFIDFQEAVEVYLRRHNLKGARDYLEGVREFMTVHEYRILNDSIEQYEAIDKAYQRRKG